VPGHDNFRAAYTSTACLSPGGLYGFTAPADTGAYEVKHHLRSVQRRLVATVYRPARCCVSEERTAWLREVDVIKLQDTDAGAEINTHGPSAGFSAHHGDQEKLLADVATEEINGPDCRCQHRFFFF